jgi:hypothetical protein
MEAHASERYIIKDGIARFLSDAVVIGWIDRYKP